jgi:hypothetical protein
MQGRPLAIGFPDESGSPHKVLRVLRLSPNRERLPVGIPGTENERTRNHWLRCCNSRESQHLGSVIPRLI